MTHAGNSKSCRPMQISVKRSRHSKSLAVCGMRVSNRNSHVDAVILEQPIDDREVAALSSRSDGVAVAGRRIDALVLQQSFDDREVAVLSSPSDGVGCHRPTDRRARLAAVARRPRGGRRVQPAG